MEWETNEIDGFTVESTVIDYVLCELNRDHETGYATMVISLGEDKEIVGTRYLAYADELKHNLSVYVRRFLEEDDRICEYMDVEIRPDNFEQGGVVWQKMNPSVIAHHYGYTANIGSATLHLFLQEPVPDQTVVFCKAFINETSVATSTLHTTDYNYAIKKTIKLWLNWLDMEVTAIMGVRDV